MASWAVLLALSGFQADLGKGQMSFAPVIVSRAETSATKLDHFRTFWSNGRAWGVYRQHQDPDNGQWQPSLKVLGGSLEGVQVTVGEQVVEV